VRAGAGKASPQISSPPVLAVRCVSLSAVRHALPVVGNRVAAAAEPPIGPAGDLFAADQLLAQARWSETIKLLLPLAESSRATGDSRTFVLAALRIGRARSRLEHHAAAAEILRSALAASQELNDPALAADVLHYLGVAHYRTGDLSVSREFFDEALRIIDDLDLRDRRGGIYIELGNQAYGQQDYSTAESRYASALGQPLVLEDRLRALCNLSLVRCDSGRFDAAIEPAQEASRLAEREQALPHLASAGLALLGRARAGRGELTEGLRLMDGAIERDRARGDRLRLATTLLFRAEALEHAGKFRISEADYLEAHRISTERSSPRDVAQAALGLARIAAAEGRNTEARRWATEGLRAAERSEGKGLAKNAKELLDRLSPPTS